MDQTLGRAMVARGVHALPPGARAAHHVAAGADRDPAQQRLRAGLCAGHDRSLAACRGRPPEPRSLTQTGWMFRLVSTWSLPTTPERAWDVIADVERWPAWWPGIAAATVVRPPGRDGLGQRTHLVVRSPLGYALRFGVEITSARAPSSASARVVGDLVGEGSWSVVPTASGCTATIRWDVTPNRWPLSVLAAPLTAPLTWAHAWVMARGQHALVSVLQN